MPVHLCLPDPLLGDLLDVKVVAVFDDLPEFGEGQVHVALDLGGEELVDVGFDVAGDVSFDELLDGGGGFGFEGVDLGLDFLVVDLELLVEDLDELGDFEVYLLLDE